MVQVDGDAVEVVHPERANVAGRFRRPRRMGPRRVGMEHRVIDDELAASLEEFTECPRPVLALEGVLLFHELPGEIAPLSAKLVAHPGELFLLRQMLLPCREPLVVLDHLVGRHVISPPFPTPDSRSVTLCSTFWLTRRVRRRSIRSPSVAAGACGG